MPESEPLTSASGPFASFEGDLDRDRVRRLFSQQSLADRVKGLLAWSAAAVVMFVLAWGMGAGDELPRVVRWTISTCSALGMFAFGLLQQSGRWHCRRWFRWNEILAGAYQITLTDDFVDVRSPRIAFRLPYVFAAMVDCGLFCVRIGLDATACRAVLLPIGDCRPSRSVADVQAFLRERIRDAKHQPAAFTRVADRDLPLPSTLTDKEEGVAFDGPLHQGQLLEAVEADNREAKLDRVRRGIYVLLAVCFVGLLTLMGVGAALHREFEIDMWSELAFLGLFLTVGAVGLLRRRWAKADVQADPEAEAGRLNGRVSPSGIAAYFVHGSRAITWAACESIEITEERILIRFWRGDFLLLGRHLFASDSDFQQASRWAASHARS